MTPPKLRDLPRVSLPYAIAAKNYGAAVAEVMKAVSASRATQAQDKPASAFTWSLVWEQAEDPQTRDPEEFIKHLAKNSKIFLVGTGFKWLGRVPVPPPVPEPIMARFEERARLICGDKSKYQRPLSIKGRLKKAEQEAIAFGAYDPQPLTVLDQWCEQHPEADQAMVKLVRISVRTLLQTTADKK